MANTMGSAWIYQRYGGAVILTDDAIASVLAPVVAGELDVPYHGSWARPPYESRAGRPVIAHDPGLSAIVVDRDRGTVVLVDSTGEGVLNASLAAFVECARRYTAAIHTPGGRRRLLGDHRQAIAGPDPCDRSRRGRR